MATNQEIFEGKLDALADSINAKAGTSGKKNIDEMKSAVDSIVLPTITIEEIEGGHRIVITDRTGTRSCDVMDGTPGESAPSYVLSWYTNPTEAQKQANLTVMNTIRSLDPGSYSLYIINGNYIFPALYVSNSVSNPSFIGLSLQDGTSLKAFQFLGTDLASYQQASWDYVEQTTFDENSQNAGAMSIIASYIDEQVEAAKLIMGANLSSHSSNENIHVTAANKTAWNAKYDKPSGGIPKTDLASAVQTSLTAADNAIPSSEKGVAGGVPTLGNDGKVPKAQLPPTVPDGGTSGQVLTKQSNQDADADWENIPTVAPITGQLILLANAWTTSDNVTYTQPVTIPASNTNSKVDLQPDATVLNLMVELGINSLYIQNNSGTLSAVAIGAEPDQNITVQYSMVITVSTDTIGAVVNINDVVQTTGDELILNGGNSTGTVEDIYPNANGISF